MELLKKTNINKYIIKSIKSKQPSYKPIYIPSLVKLETLKIYIETYFKTGFILPCKSPTGIHILFDKELDRSFRLYINYQSLNKLTIKNQYLFLLIGETLD